MRFNVKYVERRYVLQKDSEVPVNTTAKLGSRMHYLMHVRAFIYVNKTNKTHFFLLIYFN
jgi:hypothetical protein